MSLNIICKMVRLLLFLIITSIVSGCGFLGKDYYSVPENNKSKSGFILKGSGRDGPKYGYSVNNVYQIRKKDLIIEARIDNHYTSVWAVGPFMFSVIPLFGLKDGYKGELSNGRDGVSVSIAIFARKPDQLSIDFCKILISNNKGSLTPSRYKYIFTDKSGDCDCKKGESYKKGILDEPNNIFYIKLIYDQSVFPDKKIDLILPDFKYKTEKIKIPAIKYIPGSGFQWMVVL